MSVDSAVMSGLVSRWKLLTALTRREVEARYQGAMLGRLWMILSPFLLLMVYTFVFGYVLKARWGSNQDTFSFAMTLYSGLLLNSIFAESLGRAPTIIQSNTNYVKKLVFPLEILPVSLVLAALVNALLGYVILCIFLVTLGDGISWPVLALPLILVPFVLCVTGLSWFIAGLGVYFRDIGQFIQFVLVLALFMSPIFYPLSVLPDSVQIFLYLNPLTVPVEMVRYVFFQAEMPSVLSVAIYCLAAVFVFLTGYAWFRRVQDGFADVL